MANNSGSLLFSAAPAEVVRVTLRTGTRSARVLLSGTYTGLSGKFQVSRDGSDWRDVTGMNEASAGLTGGATAISLGATNATFVLSTIGWTYLRFYATAMGSGTVTGVLEDYAVPVTDLLAVLPISLSATQSTITSSSSGALVVGANGSTNPAFSVDASAGSAATGWKVTADAAASGAALSVISSGTNENGKIDAKGSGTLTLQGTATGAITLTTATTISAAATVSSTSASALAVGANGATNPVLKVNANTASVATGLHVTGAAAAGGLALAVISSGANENLTIDAKGSGTVTIGGTSTGSVNIGGNAKTVLPGTLTAGGLLTCALQIATSGPLIYSGSGAPTISAAVAGSLYIRTDGSSTSTRLYSATNTSGTWTNFTSAA